MENKIIYQNQHYIYAYSQNIEIIMKSTCLLFYINTTLNLRHGYI